MKDIIYMKPFGYVRERIYVDVNGDEEVVYEPVCDQALRYGGY